MTAKGQSRDLTRGGVTATMLRFAAPMILGNLLQQCYNIADTLIVGRCLGANALAAVGSAYTLMTFLNSILIGLCMGSGTVFSLHFGARRQAELKNSAVLAFLGIGAVSLVMQGAAFLLLDPILRLLQVPPEVYGLMRSYVQVLFGGIVFVFLYNYFAFLLRAVGDSATPLAFLAVAAVSNIGLDLVFVMALGRGVAGAAEATVLAQAFSGLGLGLWAWLCQPALRPARRDLTPLPGMAGRVARFSLAACLQQSVMNFGILMIQGLVNSFGAVVMAAFAAAVKIDSLAYMPAQEFGSAFSLFISQNHGAGRADRVRQGTRAAVRVSGVFCLAVSALVFLAAPALMRLFVEAAEAEIIAAGVGYLRIEGACYVGIGLLFLLYGYYRGIGRPEMSLVLTVISLGTRVALAYALAPVFGVTAIWWAIPIGWALADLAGFARMRRLPGGP